MPRLATPSRRVPSDAESQLRARRGPFRRREISIEVRRLLCIIANPNCAQEIKAWRTVLRM
jgi:hypothetical protein